MVTAVCPSREMLRQYSSGSLPEPESDHVASHLDACPECQATIVTLADADDTLIGQIRTPVGPESFVGEPQLHAAMAAAIATPPAGEDPRRVGLRPVPELPEMLGEYRILEHLGHGGMGRVYKALHTKLDRVVAIKVLSGGRMESRQAMARFEREMKAVGRLDHPNIVRAHDAREIDGTPVLIMEFVEGLDLAEVVRRAGMLGVAEACEVVRQTALGLQRAHEHGLVHRDIKPSNIMLARGLAPFSPQNGLKAHVDATAKKVPDPFGPAFAPDAPHIKILDLGLARFYTEGATGVSPVVSHRKDRRNLFGFNLLRLQTKSRFGFVLSMC